RRGMEGLAREVEHHRAVLADRIEHHRIVRLGGHLAKNMDALRLEPGEVRKARVGRGASEGRVRQAASVAASARAAMPRIAWPISTITGAAGSSVAASAGSARSGPATCA